MTIRYYSNTTQPVALGGGGINDSATTITVASTAGFPSVPFTIGIERGVTDKEEVCLVTAKTATQFTVTRGYDGTTAVAHDAGVAIEHCICALDFTEANAHGNATGDPLTADDVHAQYLLRRVLTTKGDLFVATGNGVIARLGAGADRSVLVADSAQAAGIKWGTGFPTGAIVMYGGSSAPSADWFLLDGSLASTTTDAALYAIVGTAFNSGGEGAGQFRLPDFRGRGGIGAGQGSGLTNRTLGYSGRVGTETHTLTAAQMPTHGHGVYQTTHTHGLYGDGSGSGTNNGIVRLGNSITAGVSMGVANANVSILASGGGDSHPIMQPSLPVNFLIRR